MKMSRPSVIHRNYKNVIDIFKDEKPFTIRGSTYGGCPIKVANSALDWDHNYYALHHKRSEDHYGRRSEDKLKEGRSVFPEYYNRKYVLKLIKATMEAEVPYSLEIMSGDKILLIYDKKKIIGHYPALDQTWTHYIEWAQTTYLGIALWRSPDDGLWRVASAYPRYPPVVLDP